MCNTKKDILSASASDDFLQYLCKAYYKDNKDKNSFLHAIVSLHNNNDIDILEAISKCNNKENDFFAVKQIFEKILPDINTPIKTVMNCVLHIYQESGNDMSASMIFTPFIEYCKKDKNKVQQAIQIINSDVENWSSFVCPVIIAGSNFNFEKYVDIAIEFTEHTNKDMCINAILSLRRLEYKYHIKQLNKAFKTVANIIDTTKDKNVLPVSIETIFELSTFDKELEERAIELIEYALKDANDIVLHSASNLCFYQREKLPIKLFSILLRALENINYKNQGTIYNINYGLRYLLENKQEDVVIAYLENTLIKNNNLSITSFEYFTHGLLTENKDIFNKIVTKWLLSGEWRLCVAVLDIVRSTPDIILSADKNILKQHKQADYLFAIRKAIGYLFSYPISATSFIICLIDLLDKKGAEEVTKLLFDPLLISYSGKIKQYLESIKKEQTNKTKKVINNLFKRLEKYHQDLKSSWNIPELKPSQEHREAYHRFHSRLMSEAMKESEKDSVFLSLVSKQIILYSNQSISYHKGTSQTEYTRSVSNLQSFTHSAEFPCLEIINPERLNLLLFDLTTEKYK